MPLKRGSIAALSRYDCSCSFCGLLLLAELLALRYAQLQLMIFFSLPIQEDFNQLHDKILSEINKLATDGPEESEVNFLLRSNNI